MEKAHLNKNNFFTFETAINSKKEKIKSPVLKPG